jgi:hypothetical protein
VVNLFQAVDGEQRVFGKVRWQFYRVRLTTSAGVYYSDPTGLLGTLTRADWRLAQMAYWSELVHMRNGDGQEGYLLKRRISGEVCPRCTDPQTGEVREPNCPVCFGTGFRCGYFYPIACVWADISPKSIRLKIDGQRGTVGGVGVSARMLNTWALSSEDVFVQKRTDDRYYIHTIQNAYEFRGVPISANVEMRLAPATDPVYAVTIPQQLL